MQYFVLQPYRNIDDRLCQSSPIIPPDRETLNIRRRAIFNNILSMFDYNFFIP